MMLSRFFLRPALAALLIVLKTLPGYSYSGDGSSEEWKLRKDDNGIQVYTRKVADASVDELKFVAVVHGSLSSVAALVQDANNFSNWIYGCSEARILTQLSSNEQYQYQVMDAPYPVSDRDMIIHFTIWQDTVTKVIHTHALAAPEYLPLNKDRIRLTLYDGSYTITPVGNGNVRVEYAVKLDPAGSLPSWITNLSIVVGPYQSALKMQGQLDRPEYRNRVLPYIKEP